MDPLVRRVAPATNLPISLDDAKRHLRVEHNDEDALILALVAVATAELETVLGRTLCETTWQASLDAFPQDDALFLPMVPLLTLDALAHYDETGLLTMFDMNAIIVDAVSEPARILPAPGTTWPATQARPNAVLVTYKAGYKLGGSTAEQQAAVPPEAVAWLKLRIGALYTHRESWTVGDKLNDNPFIDRLIDGLRVYA